MNSELCFHLGGGCIGVLLESFVESVCGKY
jgi:hypothetical protein